MVPLPNIARKSTDCNGLPEFFPPIVAQRQLLITKGSVMRPRYFDLEHVPKGDVLFLSGCSQCGSTGTISIEGPLNRPLVLRKSDANSNPRPLEGDSCTADVTGDGPIRLKVEINVDSELKVIKSGVLIADRDGKEKGLHFTFDIEDSSDNDFSDYSPLYDHIKASGKTRGELTTISARLLPPSFDAFRHPKS